MNTAIAIGIIIVLYLFARRKIKKSVTKKPKSTPSLLNPIEQKLHGAYLNFKKTPQNTFHVAGAELMLNMGLDADTLKKIEEYLFYEKKHGADKEHSPSITKIDFFAARKHRHLALDKISDQHLTELFNWAKKLYTKEFKYVQLDEYWTVKQIKEHSIRKNKTEIGFYSKVPYEDEEAKADLEKVGLLEKEIRKTFAPLLGENKSSIILSDDGNENTEYGIHVIIGEYGILVWCNRWIL